MYSIVLVALSCALVFAPGLVVVLRNSPRIDDESLVEF